MYSLDTHAAIRDLEAAGLASRQAEAIVAAGSRADKQLATRVDVAAAKSDVAAIKSDVAAVGARVAAVETKVAAVGTDVAAIKSDVAAIKVDVARFEGRIATVESNLAAQRSESRLMFGFLFALLLVVFVRVLASV